MSGEISESTKDLIQSGEENKTNQYSKSVRRKLEYSHIGSLS